MHSTATSGRESFSAVSRRKHADLASSMGAGVLGVAIGAFLAAALRPIGWPLLVVGVVLHAWGMFARHRLDVEHEAPVPKWALALYWACWVALPGLALYAFLRA